MKTIKLKVPNNWNDITIRQYQKFMVLMDSKKKEREKTMDLISLFCNVPKKQLKNFAIGDLEKIGSILLKMTKEEPTTIKLTKHVNFKDAIYSILPNMSRMTTGEFVDLENYCEDIVNNLHKIMSVLYRKQEGNQDKWGRYSVEDYDPTEDKERVMLDFPMGYALGVLNFFFHLEKKLLTDSRNYLAKLT